VGSPCSVLILTLNEEKNIEKCIRSVRWSDDVVVLDSYSSDNTVEIAKSAGATVFQRKFDNYASQRNFGLNQINYKHPWLMMLDADEKVPPDLADEISSVLNSGPFDICLYRMRRKDFFMGRWIKHSSGYPTWFGRLMKRGHVRVERAINEEYVTDGKVDYLMAHLHHYPFNKGFAAWFDKHNHYSSMEARLFAEGQSDTPDLSSFFAKDPTIRRKAIKSLTYRLPARPFVMFCALFFFRGGFLDGWPGLTYCLLRSFYEFMINCKVKEYQRRKEGLAL